ncbi:MAG: hypothetical protein IKB27_01385 [Clostridia bacterium]|nr:hypothetical protein [Clostridia bacterium]
MTIIVSQAQVNEINELLNRTDAAFLDLFRSELDALREQLSKNQVSTLTLTEILTAVNVYQKTKRSKNEKLSSDVCDKTEEKKKIEVLLAFAKLLSTLLIISDQGQQNNNTNEIRR